MGFLRIVHYLGSFLLLVAAVLLIITSISAPVVSQISMLSVRLRSTAGDINFGTFGYCVEATARNAAACTKSAVGYDISKVIGQVNGIDFDKYATDTVDGLTHVMVLHPICAGLSFITFVLSLTSGGVGGILAMLAALFTFIITLVACVIDFVMFGIVKNKVNDTRSATAEWGSASWTTLVALICLFAAFVITFLTCCAGRRQKKREHVVVKERTDYGHATRRRRHFWQRR